MGQSQSSAVPVTYTPLNSESTSPTNKVRKNIAGHFALKNYDDAISNSIRLLEMLDEPNRRKSLVNKLEAISNLHNNTKKGTLLAKMLPTILRPS